MRNPKAEQTMKCRICGNDENDAIGLMDTFFSGWLSMNEKVKTFEERFSKFLGVKHSIAVNSGSSANLLALTTLFCNDVPSESRLKAGDEIITPAVTWPTTCYPILQVGQYLSLWMSIR
jgi:CDP-6-deoxy-D-xylo-4-hexulose-3-dehydrase